MSATKHLVRGYKHATPVEEAFAREKRIALKTEPLTEDYPTIVYPRETNPPELRHGRKGRPAGRKRDTRVFMRNGEEYASANHAWRMVTGSSNYAHYYVGRILPRRIMCEGRWRYSVSDLRRAYEARARHYV